MGRRLSERAQRRTVFLHMLANGISASQAAAHGRISWTTLYRWRRQDAAFCAAWDEAAQAGAALAAARRDDEMFRRALQPVAHPVRHRGEVVGVRQRYSDSGLAFAIRDLRLRRQTMADAPPPPRVRVVVDRLADDD